MNFIFFNTYELLQGLKIVNLCICENENQFPFKIKESILINPRPVNLCKCENKNLSFHFEIKESIPHDPKVKQSKKKN